MGGTTVLTGSLEFLSLGDLLQLIGSNGSTGVLRLRSKFASDTGEVFIHKGNPVNSSNGSLSGIDAVYSLFGWTIGQFDFLEGSINCETLIKKSRMNIILDSLSMLDEGVIEKLGPVSYTPETSGASTRGAMLPTIKGPMVDYVYVVDEEAFHDGQEITVEGKHGNWIWVIIEGTVKIQKTVDNECVQLLRVSEGAFLGSTSSFLINGNVRGVTSVASGDVQLGVLDLQRLSAEFSQMSANFKGMVIGLDRRLRGVTDNALAIRSKKKMDDAFFQDRKLVIKQGDQEEGVFSLTKGEAHVVSRTEQGMVPLATLTPNDVFGQIPFLNFGHEPLGAAVYGSADMKVKPLSLDDLNQEYDELSTTFKNILEYNATCITVTTRLAYDFLNKMQAPKKKKARTSKK